MNRHLAGMFAVAVVLFPSASPSADGEGDLAARVDKRIKAWQPTKEERLLDEIGWARDIPEALKLAKEKQRPVFLFTYSGSAVREHAMALQRC